VFDGCTSFLLIERHDAGVEYYNNKELFKHITVLTVWCVSQRNAFYTILNQEIRGKQINDGRNDIPQIKISISHIYISYSCGQVITYIKSSTIQHAGSSGNASNLNISSGTKTPLAKVFVVVFS